MSLENNNKNDVNNSMPENDLRILRENKGLTIQEVADELKLTPTKILKLENSDFKDLGANTYVRGYLNYYAELLGVDAKKYNKLIPKTEINIPLVNTSSNISGRYQFKRQSKTMANYAIGTLIVFVLGFSGWFVLQNYANHASKDQFNVDTTQSDDLNFNIAQDIQNNNSTDNKDSFHYSSIIPTLDQDNSTDTIELPDANNLNLDEKINELNDFTENQTDSLIDESSVEENNTDQVTDPQEVADTKVVREHQYEIKIIAKQTSWVKVEHLNGKKLHNQMLNPGELLLVSDEPVHFRIGNGKNVSVFINGKDINLSKLTRKDIADFNWPRVN